MIRSFYALFICSACLLAISFTGCGPKAPYDIVPIEGTVTYKGQALQGCSLTFSVGDYRDSVGFVDSTGRFTTIHTPEIKGVPKGSCIVRVGWTGEGNPPAELKELFEKYGDGKEGLAIEITKPDKNLTLNFE